MASDTHAPLAAVLTTIAELRAASADAARPSSDASAYDAFEASLAKIGAAACLGALVREPVKLYRLSEHAVGMRQRASSGALITQAFALVHFIVVTTQAAYAAVASAAAPASPAVSSPAITDSVVAEWVTLARTLGDDIVEFRQSPSHTRASPSE